jgi:hypothetical protein
MVLKIPIASIFNKLYDSYKPLATKEEDGSFWSKMVATPNSTKTIKKIVANCSILE